MHNPITINLLFKSYNHYYIKNSLLHLSKTITGWGVPLINFKYIPLPKQRKRITLLKSPHVHKKAREQFEMSRKKSCIQIQVSTQKQAYLILLLLHYSKFPGVQVKLNIKYYTNS